MLKMLPTVQRGTTVGIASIPLKLRFWCMSAVHVCVRRVSIVAKEGIPCLVRALGSVEDLDAVSAEALSSTLRVLLPSCDSLGGRVGFVPRA